MEQIYDIFERYRDYILVFILFIIITLSEGIIYHYIKEDLKEIKSSLEVKKESQEITKENETKKAKTEEKQEIYVDVKGQVLSPGVYRLKEGQRVVDAIKKAGGLTTNADTSINNLGKKLTDEMAIVIYSKKQVKKMSKTLEKKNKEVETCQNENPSTDNSCLTQNNLTDKKSSKKENSQTNQTKKTSKVSINKASKEELMTLTGIGESKAKAIIEYRTKNKFNSIEDIKNVTGIGDKLFEKIKDNIEL